MAKRLNDLTASEAVARLAAGDITSEALVRDCLDRIDTREKVVGAWAHLDPDKAIAEAQDRDRKQTGGALHGLPLAVKDVIDTADMPTEQGSPIHAGRQPAEDAVCVARARAAGAVILGKTATTEFAAMTPTKTANPRDPARTPGGSSSGSAAAVADNMTPLALGTQTIGSTIRPAAYCGVVGFKPSYGTFDLTGVADQSQSMDTLGLMARCVDDVALLAGTLSDAGQAFDLPDMDDPPRIGFCRSPQWSEAEPPTVAAMDEAVRLLADADAEIIDVDLPPAFGDLLDAQWTLLSYEFARNLADERRDHGDQLSAPLRDLLDRGDAMPEPDYQAALLSAAKCRRDIAALTANYDVLLTPSAAGEAPELGAATDLLFQRLWTVLHVPCITLPAFTGPSGLPVGIQLVGRRGEDDFLLEIAKWAEGLLCPDGPRPLP